MQKVKISDLKDPKQKISVGPMSYSQLRIVQKKTGTIMLCNSWTANRSFSFYHQHVGYSCKVGISFDEIDFEEKEVDHYLCPIDMLRRGIKKGEKTTRCDNDFYVVGGIVLPVELVEKYFEPVYKKKTIHIKEGHYTLEQLEEIKGRF